MDLTHLSSGVLLESFPYLLAVLGATTVVSLGLSLTLLIRQSRFSKRYNSLYRGIERKNIEDIMAECLAELAKTQGRYQKFEAEIDEIRNKIAGSIQHVGVVRYSAYDGMGSDLSFSAAFLDDNFNGLVISSLFGRDESRMYAKPILNGRSSYLLTEEEQNAVRDACASKTLSRRVNKKGISLYQQPG
ncbi:MAG: DUF4446 family protein [bacterium]|jgi:hypothetical protein